MFSLADTANPAKSRSPALVVAGTLALGIALVPVVVTPWSTSNVKPEKASTVTALKVTATGSVTVSVLDVVKGAVTLVPNRTERILANPAPLSSNAPYAFPAESVTVTEPDPLFVATVTRRAVPVGTGVLKVHEYVLWLTVLAAWQTVPT